MALVSTKCEDNHGSKLRYYLDGVDVDGNTGESRFETLLPDGVDVDGNAKGTTKSSMGATLRSMCR